MKIIEICKLNKEAILKFKLPCRFCKQISSYREKSVSSDRFTIISTYTFQQLLLQRTEKTGESEVSKQHLRCIAVHRSPCGLGDKRPFSIVERAYFTRKRHGNNGRRTRKLKSGIHRFRRTFRERPRALAASPFPFQRFARPCEETQHFYLTFSWIDSRSNLS